MERPDLDITATLATAGSIAYGSLLTQMSCMQRRIDYQRVAAIRASGAAVRAVKRSQHGRRLAAMDETADRAIMLRLIDIERLRSA